MTITVNMLYRMLERCYDRENIPIKIDQNTLIIGFIFDIGEFKSQLSRIDDDIISEEKKQFIYDKVWKIIHGIQIDVINVVASELMNKVFENSKTFEQIRLIQRNEVDKFLAKEGYSGNLVDYLFTNIFIDFKPKE